MNILFNASQCGLGNNGGTKTIIRCTETLQDMGHNVHIWTNAMQYSWHKPQVEIFDTTSPFLDSNGRARDTWHKEIIVSVWEIEDLFNHHSYLASCFWYMRGWEKWVKGEEWLIQQIKKFVAAGGRIIVNSSWLIDKLLRMGIDCVLCYSGLDLDVWEERNIVKELSFGCIWESKHKTKRGDLCKRVSYYTKNEVPGGAWWVPLDGNLGTYEELVNLYNNCDIWFAPTELEGFHQCPAEANLCGCLVVCNRMPSNGMGDYATDETAMRYDTWDELIECIENPDFSKVKLMQDVLKNKIGDRESNMKRFVEILSE